MVDHLQGGFQGIQLQSSAKHTDFNRIRVRKIYRRVTSGTGILCVVHLLGRGEADTIPRRPAVHLGLGAAAEAKQLRPEFLDEVQQASNRGFLLLISTAECQARDVYMKSTSPGRVAQITHATGLAENFRPRHFIQVVVQRHRMGYELQTFIQTAICLDVQVFSVLVRDVEQLLRIAVDCTAVVDFKLNAEMPQALAMEHEVGRVAVFVNDVVMLVPAGCAVGVVVIVPIRAVTMNNTVAVLTADVVFIKAVVAKRVRVILDGIFLVDPLSAVVADYGQAICAVLAEPVILYLEHFVNRMLRTTVCTNSCFTHWLFLHFV